jgi:hypothetical protein
MFHDPFHPTAQTQSASLTEWLVALAISSVIFVGHYYLGYYSVMLVAQLSR